MPGDGNPWDGGGRESAGVKDIAENCLQDFLPGGLKMRTTVVADAIPKHAL